MNKTKKGKRKAKSLLKKKMHGRVKKLIRRRKQNK
ncbi:MAG: hypothetical protein US11_C0001G0011 [Candidatus Roizmanbacteria bacterium GW2011_GWA2_36_23]|uniref:Uncharacterized protein n=1 Tax=Candidatus Roizmanbacteria bacterium GW2011_GWA2_36_23 TaxID=1618480 RepID=A0A0G0E951_9BACT|nr:MAG: hypothetical protein US11_C0001G0011 [Candidatus Roizmanbacteria bacterium GW2011_GWA2_36_23]